MSQLDLNATVAQWVAQRPETSRIFETLRIDYCCHGHRPLGEACRARALDPQHVLAQLDESSRSASPGQEEDWTRAGLARLCDHIEATHHAYLRRELPRLTGLIDKVASAHGEHHPELAELKRVFAQLRGELEPHMMKEEQILFPAIRRLEAAAAAPPTFHFGPLANPIRMMEHEHENAGAALARIRDLTADYRLPADACNTYRAMLDALRRLEQDLHLHIHKENNILFPRALAHARQSTAEPP